MKISLTELQKQYEITMSWWWLLQFISNDLIVLITFMVDQ